MIGIRGESDWVETAWGKVEAKEEKDGNEIDELIAVNMGRVNGGMVDVEYGGENIGKSQRLYRVTNFK